MGLLRLHAGLSRSRDNIQNQLSELAKQKPRNQEDDNLISEMTRLESVLQVARDDLVRHHNFFFNPCAYISIRAERMQP